MTRPRFDSAACDTLAGCVQEIERTTDAELGVDREKSRQRIEAPAHFTDHGVDAVRPPGRAVVRARGIELRRQPRQESGPPDIWRVLGACGTGGGQQQQADEEQAPEAETTHTPSFMNPTMRDPRRVVPASLDRTRTAARSGSVRATPDG